MPEGFEIIRARVKDDAPILIDRLLKSKQGEVVLVLPKNSIITANLNSLRILQQEAESIGKVMSISTENRDIKSFAQALQISIYGSGRASKAKKKEIAEKRKSTTRMMDIMPPSYRRRAEIEIVPEEPEPEVPQIENIPEQILPDVNAEIPQEPVYETSYDIPKPPENSDLEKNLESFYTEGKNETPLILKTKKYFSFNKMLIALVALGVLSLISVVYLVLPKAEIRLTLNKMPLKAAIPVAVSKNISSANLASGIVPGQYFLLSKSGSKTFSVKSEKKEIFSKARGFIDIYNAYSSAPQRLVAQTRFETKDGKIFKIQKAVIVPGAKVSGNNLTPSFIRAEVIADQAGEEYNIGPSYFTIPGFKGTPKYAGFYAKSAESMASGKIGAGSQLTLEEIENAKNEFKNELVKELEADTLGTIKDSDLKLIAGASSVKIDEFKSSVPAGSNADSFAVTMKITWQAMVFKDKDFRDIIAYFIISKYPEIQNFKFEDAVEYPQATKIDFKKGEMFFTYNLDKENVFDADIKNLKKDLAGKNESEMRDVISSKKFINSAAISLSPFWVKKAPASEGKISITIDNE